MTVGRIPNIEGGIQPTLLTTTGDIMYASSASNPARLGIGSSAQVLTVASGVPSWATPAASIPATDTASVATSQTTTSTSFVALTTAGPAVTVTTGVKALVIVTCDLTNSGTSARAYMSYSVSGATTIGASDTVSLKATNPSGTRASAASVPTLTAGSNTFTALYRVSGSTGTFFDRSIFVMNLA